MAHQPSSISPSIPTEREKFKFWMGFVKWLIVSVAITLAGLFIGSGFKERTTGIQEMQAFDKYAYPMLDADNFDVRWNLSEFFFYCYAHG